MQVTVMYQDSVGNHCEEIHNGSLVVILSSFELEQVRKIVIDGNEIEFQNGCVDFYHSLLKFYTSGQLYTEKPVSREEFDYRTKVFLENLLTVSRHFC